MRTTHPLAAAAYPSRNRQRGQALVFVTVTVLVMVIAMMMTYSMGQLTNHKTRLQNTADAAAYSAALAQARDYNLSAYLNRAMIANDVSVAQQLALRSWVYAFNETFKEKGLTDKYAPAPATGGPLNWVQGGPMYPLWQNLEKGARALAGGLEPLLNTFTPGYIDTVYYLNTAYAMAQKVYHYSTALTVAQTIGWLEATSAGLGSLLGGGDLMGEIGAKLEQALTLGVESNVVKMNDPRASLSTIGILTFLFDTKKWLEFTENRNPVGPWGVDEENTNASYTIPGGYKNIHTGTDYACTGYKPEWRVWCEWRDEQTITYGVNNKRDYVNDAGLKDRKDLAAGENLLKEYDGPSRDRYANVVRGMLDEFSTDRNGDWAIPFPKDLFPVGFIDIVLGVGPSAKPPSWLWKQLFHSSEGVELWNDERETTLAGSGQGYKMPGSWNRRWKTGDTVELDGLFSMPVTIMGWTFNVPAPSPPLSPRAPAYSPVDITAATGEATGNSSKGDPHVSVKPIFRKYRDVTNIAQGTDSANQNWTSPPLLVEIERSTRTVPTSDSSRYARELVGCTTQASVTGQPVNQVFAPGNFLMGDGSSSSCMRAMAKAEAYFSRPRDLFPREDGKTEYGSLYSPYWQARLVKTTPQEQTISLIWHYCNGTGGFMDCAAQLMNDWGTANQSFWNAIRGMASSLTDTSSLFK